VLRQWSLDRAVTIDEVSTSATTGAPGGSAAAGPGQVDLDELEEKLMARLRYRLRVERERSTGWI
jgi:hypothetical protein